MPNGNLKVMQARSLEAIRNDIGNRIEALFAAGRDALAAVPEQDRPRALEAGEVKGISPFNGALINAMVSAHCGEPLDGLFRIGAHNDIELNLTILGCAHGADSAAPITQLVTPA
jgi:hypothetical protein